jgi:hypothetical protein
MKKALFIGLAIIIAGAIVLRLISNKGKLSQKEKPLPARELAIPVTIYKVSLEPVALSMEKTGKLQF